MNSYIENSLENETASVDLSLKDYIAYNLC
jgi:hypothetical protein